ncbi:MAG TPA: hypothetical protein VFO79_10870 [Xanthomonadales bacterium]|nr:hypothetical protein [Xanthomonadales bacterium]
MTRAALAASARPWLAALAASLVALWMFWPGYTSVDSLYQYQQALAGRYDNVHPPLFAFAWRALAMAWPGSGAMHALLVGGFFLGLARTLWALPLGERTRLVAFVAIGAWPPVLLVVAHVWKDVAMCAAMLLGCAAVLRHRTGGGHRDAAFAVAWLALAVAMRHNAWPAVLPFVALLFAPRTEVTPLASRVRRWAAGVAIALALLAVPRAIEHALSAERRPLWPTVALWDLAAVSLATGEVRLPRAVAPTLALADLAAHYRAWSCVPLYDSGLIRLALHVPYTEAEVRAVDAAWLAGVRDAPGAYLAHRARVLAGLYWRPPSDAPRELVYVAAHRVAAPERAAPAPTRLVLAFAARAWDTPAFAWLPYLALALLSLPFARPRARTVPLLLVASAACYAAPLALVATSSEYRYVFWPVVACLLATAAALGSRSGARRQVAHSDRRE